jgi:hypothetical protein
MIKGKWQIAATALGAMVVTFAFVNDASARRGIRRAHFGRSHWHRRTMSTDSHPAAVVLPPMRHYGVRSVRCGGGKTST